MDPAEDIAELVAEILPRLSSDEWGDFTLPREDAEALRAAVEDWRPRFCACGRVVSRCDGSRRACRDRVEAA